MVQLQSNTSWAASSLTLASSYSATLQMLQMLNTQSGFWRSRTSRRRKKNLAVKSKDDCLGCDLNDRL